MRCGHFVLVYFYSNEATLVTYGTKSTPFLCLRLNNIMRYPEIWYTIGIEPSSRPVHSSIRDEHRRQLTLKLMKTFIFFCFKDLFLASYDGFFMIGATYTPLLGIFVTKQPEEGSIRPSNIRIPIRTALIALCNPENAFHRHLPTRHPFQYFLVRQ